MTTELPPTPRDEKDWTWVLERPCQECGFAGVPLAEVPGLIRASIAPFRDALAAPEAAVRTRRETVWSTVEYACHVRDVCRVFDGRLGTMLVEDGTQFASWDANDAAIEGHYSTADPSLVADEYARAAENIAATFESATPAQVGHRGLRGDGMAFTVATLATYFVHEIVHHLHDVS